VLVNIKDGGEPIFYDSDSFRFIDRRHVQVDLLLLFGGVIVLTATVVVEYDIENYWYLLPFKITEVKMVKVGAYEKDSESLVNIYEYVKEYLSLSLERRGDHDV